MLTVGITIAKALGYIALLAGVFILFISVCVTLFNFLRNLIYHDDLNSQE